jgi:(E)-4-hydroxy-3-methylbut-2-enyl-diphosphate synthase
MTNTDTKDVEATVAQIKALEAAGCDIARVSVYDSACANAVGAIKARTSIPLVADIHFDHKLAIQAIENGVDKVRINPGNIGAKKEIAALAACLKMHNTPVRIGVNAGSLESDLIKEHGRPTPRAMADSALRHVALLELHGYNNIVLSMKASNVADTVAAYRLMHGQTAYPLHVGVTEAGFGELAVMKSAIGIGALLLDGIGDTIRVSITGDPVQEVRIAKEILRAVGLRREGVEFISCPTCARCGVELEAIVKHLREHLPQTGKSLTVAVMGCAVNGPGEAREADIGIAFGKGNGVLFKRGAQFASGGAQQMINLLVSEARAML